VTRQAGVPLDALGLQRSAKNWCIM